MKRVGLTIIVLALGLICFVAPVTAGEYRVGLLLPLTGPSALMGKQLSQGWQVVQEMVNDRGGVNGNKIVYVKADAPDPTAAASECNRLITQEKVELIVGSGTTGNSIAATAVAEKAKVFYFEAQAAGEAVTGRGFKYTFRFGPNMSFVGRITADYIYQDIGKWLGMDSKNLKVILVHEDGPYGSTFGALLKEAAKSKGFNINEVLSYSTKLTDLSSLILKLKGLNPDVLVAISYLNDAILMNKQMKQYNFVPKAFMGVGTGFTVTEYIQDRGKDINGSFISWVPTYLEPENLREEGKKLREEYLSRFRKMFNEEPVDVTTGAFGAGVVLFNDIVARAGSLDPDKLRAAALAVDKPYGTYPNGFGVKFDEAGQNQRAVMILSQYQNQKPVHLSPLEIASGKPIMVPLPPWSERK